MIPENKQPAVKKPLQITDAVFSFQDISKTAWPLAGGKAANLGELAKIEGIQVPDGFCISTEVFKKLVRENPAVNSLLDQLSLLKTEDRHKIAELCSEIKKRIEEIIIPADIIELIENKLSGIGEKYSWAIRSSATAEDLPNASFAGQHNTYLNIIGKDAILKHISSCWASLFTERAVIYRLQNGFDHSKVLLSVIVQKMIFADAAGIMFTADPVNSNRKMLSVDAGFGLGEALVEGLVSADCYKVRDGEIAEKIIATKKLAIYALKEGGTKAQPIHPDQQKLQTLTNEQILQLAHTGRKIEKHFGYPQDIEWCLANNTFYIVQSRPITTLFPLPQANDEKNHVYISVGHQQMMTDAIKPLGLSLRQLTALRPMFTAGGRQFVDITKELASPGSREMIIDVLGKSEPLIRDALVTITERPDFIKFLPADAQEQPGGTMNKFRRDDQPSTHIDPAIVDDLIKRSQTSVETLKQNIQTKSGIALFDFILEDIQLLKKILADPQGFAALKAGMDASFWINEKMNEWLDEKGAADTLSQSVPNNITSEMGLALLDLADAIRPYPDVIEYLQHIKNDEPLETGRLNGGHETLHAMNVFLSKYGMRCAGEIDITKTRWAENPAILVPILLCNIKNYMPGESNRKFEHGQQQALKKEQELLGRLKQLPGAEQKVAATKQMIDQIRNFIGYREYPKYGMINRYFIYKQALLKEAEQLLKAGLIYEKEDIYYLSLEELREVVATHKIDQQLIRQRKDQHKLNGKLLTPRVITSDGEIITGRYKRYDLPAGAIAGLAVSAGVIEGRARVMLNMEEANLEEGDILVTAFTDPGWTALFISIKGLVTEAGGQMTHGAVIAREYGLPAVVGVENATRLIKDGQQIRINGTEGYVEIL